MRSKPSSSSLPSDTPSVYATASTSVSEFVVVDDNTFDVDSDSTIDIFSAASGNIGDGGSASS